jgi:hypothetical protein
MTACLLENCTMHDGWSMSLCILFLNLVSNEIEIVLTKVQASVCDLPHPDRSAVPMVLAVAVYIVTTVLIVLRLISKIWVSQTMGLDDWTIIVAQVCLMLVYKSGANSTRPSCLQPPTLQLRVWHLILLLNSG